MKTVVKTQLKITNPTTVKAEPFRQAVRQVLASGPDPKWRGLTPPCPDPFDDGGTDRHLCA
jgi:hypothetical protein